MPRKVVIVDRTDEAHPAYIARLTWNTSPQFSKDTFAFKPAQGCESHPHGLRIGRREHAQEKQNRS